VKKIFDKGFMQLLTGVAILFLGPICIAPIFQTYNEPHSWWGLALATMYSITIAIVSIYWGIRFVWKSTRQTKREIETKLRQLKASKEDQ